MALTDAFDIARRTGFTDPRSVAAVSAALARWGPSLATLYAAAALRHPRRAAIVDHRGSLTFHRLDARSTALARGLRRAGLRPGQHLGLLAHNHRDFVEANIAAAKAGLPVVYLNTGFAAPQLGEVAARESIAGIVVDADLHPVVEGSGFDGPVVVADGEAGRTPTMRAVRDVGRRTPSLLLPRMTSPVLLTSGTTGTPKGAQRRLGSAGLSAGSGILQVVPFRTGDVFVIPCPLFHAWGLAQLTIAAVLGSTAVLVRRFEPETTLAAVAEHDATVLAVVPVMLQRMLEGDLLDRHRTGSLRIVASSGSALPGPVALEWMDRTGDNLYNLYGSTEVGQATIATPADLRDAPGTAGRVAPGTTVTLLDEDGAEVPHGATGRIFVHSGAEFSGYTGGGTKEQVGELMSTGDVGFFDDEGRLFVTGRSDDMIVSGGENVFPAEVEDVLLGRTEIADAAVVGVADDDFGQRLAAFVVLAAGASMSEEDVREMIGARLARHKVPRDVRFVATLPRTPTGKLLRRQLEV